MNLDGYIDVATRLKLAALRFPELRIIEHKPVVVEAGGQLFIEARVTVSRSPEDIVPVTAYCREEFPGKNKFTRGAEQPNASTSAVGRALRWIMPDLEGPVASRDEVRNRQQSSPARPDREAGPSRSEPRPEADPEGPIERPRTTKLASDPQKRLIKRLCAEKAYEFEGDLEALSMGEAIKLIDILKQLEGIK